MLLEAYTPREHLLFQSTLRMPRDVTKAQREQRVDACIKMFLGPVEAMGWKVEIPTCLNSRHWTRAKLVEWFGYGSIPIDTFLVGWTSIYQLFLGFTRYQGFDPSPTGGMISDSEICSFADLATKPRLGLELLSCKALREPLTSRGVHAVYDMGNSKARMTPFFTDLSTTWSDGTFSTTFSSDGWLKNWICICQVCKEVSAQPHRLELQRMIAVLVRPHKNRDQSRIPSS